MKVIQQELALPFFLLQPGFPVEVSQLTVERSSLPRQSGRKSGQVCRLVTGHRTKSKADTFYTVIS